MQSLRFLSEQTAGILAGKFFFLSAPPSSRGRQGSRQSGSCYCAPKTQEGSCQISSALCLTSCNACRRHSLLDSSTPERVHCDDITTWRQYPEIALRDQGARSLDLAPTTTDLVRLVADEGIKAPGRRLEGLVGLAGGRSAGG